MHTASSTTAPEARQTDWSMVAAVDFTLPAIMDMRAARGFKKSLEELYALDRACVIEAHEVARTSTGCLQVFAAFVLAMANARHLVTLRQPSPVFIEAAEQLGLSSFLEACHLEF